MPRPAIPYVPAKPLKHVPQRRHDDCGVASTAMLAGVSYAQARSVMIDERAQTFLTDTAEVRRGLAAFGIRLGNEVPCKDWDKLLPLGRLLLVSVNYNEQADSDWHWMVFDPSRPETPVFDPDARRASPRAIDRRSRLYSYFLLKREPAAA